jgi:hypothetical protein
MNILETEEKLLTSPIKINFLNTNNLRRSISIIEGYYGKSFEFTDIRDKFKRKIQKLPLEGMSIYHNGDNALMLQMEFLPNGVLIANHFISQMLLLLPFETMGIESIF